MSGANSVILNELGQLRSLMLQVLAEVAELKDLKGSGAALGASSASTNEPEPIHKCVQCSVEYKESDNAKGSCKFHAQSWFSQGRGVVFRCCRATGSSAAHVDGCVRGKHAAKHHNRYAYAAYARHIADVSNNGSAWLHLNGDDFARQLPAHACLGLLPADPNDDNDGGDAKPQPRLFVVLGSSHACGEYVATFSPEELSRLGVHNNSESVDLTTTASTTTTLIHRLGEPDSNDDTPSPWWAHAAWVHAGDEPSRIVGVEISVKLTQDTRASTVRRSLAIDPHTKALVTGVPVVVSTGETMDYLASHTEPADAHDETLFPLAPTTRDGPSLDTTAPPPVNDDTTPATTCCQGDSVIVLRPDAPTTAQQRRPYRCLADTDVVEQTVTSSVLVSNPTAETVSVIDMRLEYCNSDGTWVPMEGVRHAPGGMGSRNWCASGTGEVNILNVGAGETMRLGVEGHFSVPGLVCATDANRVHVSLPQPLRVRLTITDLHDKTVSLVREHTNSPLVLPSSERVASDAGVPLLHLFVSVDDTAALQRHPFAVYHKSGEIFLKRDGQYCSFSPLDFARIAYRTVHNTPRAQGGQHDQSDEAQSDLPLMLEHELAQITADQAKFKAKAFALVGRRNSTSQPVVYGLRIELRTPTSFVSTSTRLPLLLPSHENNKSTLCVSPSPVLPRGSLTVSFTHLPPGFCSPDDYIAIVPAHAPDREYASLRLYEHPFSTSQPPTSSGSLSFSAPSLSGSYQARYYLYGKFQYPLVSSEPFTVQ